jgi:hypothetical protein
MIASRNADAITKAPITPSGRLAQGAQAVANALRKEGALIGAKTKPSWATDAPEPISFAIVPFLARI